MPQFSDFDANGTCDVIGAWPLRKILKIFVKVIFLETVFNDEKNDTLVGSLRAILPDLNESIIHQMSYSRNWVENGNKTKKLCHT